MLNLIWKIYTKILRLSIKYSRDPRPGSAPFISGDGFRALAKHIHDETQTFDPSAVKSSDIIFMNADLIETYFQEIHPKISASYRLITHNSDRNIGEKELA